MSDKVREEFGYWDCLKRDPKLYSRAELWKEADGFLKSKERAILAIERIQVQLKESDLQRDELSERLAILDVDLGMARGRVKEQALLIRGLERELRQLRGELQSYRVARALMPSAPSPPSEQLQVWNEKLQRFV